MANAEIHMDTVHIIPADHFGKNFIPQEYLPPGKDEHYLRDMQAAGRKRKWRHLRSDEVERLVKNINTAENWDEILVTEVFDPDQIKNTDFYGLVRIGSVRRAVLEHHDLQHPVGITNSQIIACDIGDDCAIHHVSHLAHTIIGNRCILANIHEMHTTNYAKFGNGIVKEGEPEAVRIWIDLMNETGCRGILPFEGIIPADATLWARYRDDDRLQKRLLRITQASFDSRRGYYGTVGDQCVIKNSQILKDVKIGDACYIKGANKLKNLTIRSSEDEPTQIGEGVELVNGIIGYGCHIFYGCKAVRFILGDNSNLKYGARLIHSFLGDNSTISCCEVLNNLIFPSHEQHHNNSFLIASLVMGQSNIAAGATVGSNHNSRANDNEIQAGRGFWPGLCTSLKHSSRFASYTLISKGDYPAELDIPLPFSLLNNHVSDDVLEVMPAFWWMYNMYALARNAWKFQSRDKRKNKVQAIEFDFLAPDTVEEIIRARSLLESWTAKARLHADGASPAGRSEKSQADMGRRLLESGKQADNLEILGEHMEKSGRKVRILKARQAYQAYGDMLHFYAVKNLIEYLEDNPKQSFRSMCRRLRGRRITTWANLGGQVVPEKDVDRLRADIAAGRLPTWESIHRRYAALWRRYRLDKQKHAFAVLCQVLGSPAPSPAQWTEAVEKAVRIKDFIRDQVYISRKKDFENPFKRMTFRNEEEMDASLGSVDGNSFVRQMREEAAAFRKTAAEIRRRS
jgi:NDP-sugar pyrophosphorylase family protein